MHVKYLFVQIFCYYSKLSEIRKHKIPVIQMFTFHVHHACFLEIPNGKVTLLLTKYSSINNYDNLYNVPSSESTFCDLLVIVVILKISNNNMRDGLISNCLSYDEVFFSELFQKCRMRMIIERIQAYVE